MLCVVHAHACGWIYAWVALCVFVAAPGQTAWVIVTRQLVSVSGVFALYACFLSDCSLLLLRLCRCVLVLCAAAV